MDSSRGHSSNKPAWCNRRVLHLRGNPSLLEGPTPEATLFTLPTFCVNKSLPGSSLGALVGGWRISFKARLHNGSLPVRPLRPGHAKTSHGTGPSADQKRSNSRGTYLAHSFQGSFFLDNLQKPEENRWFSNRTTVEKNKNGQTTVRNIREPPNQNHRRSPG